MHSGGIGRLSLGRSHAHLGSGQWAAPAYSIGSTTGSTETEYAANRFVNDSATLNRPLHKRPGNGDLTRCASMPGRRTLDPWIHRSPEAAEIRLSAVIGLTQSLSSSNVDEMRKASIFEIDNCQPLGRNPVLANEAYLALRDINPPFANLPECWSDHSSPTYCQIVVGGHAVLNNSPSRVKDDALGVRLGAHDNPTDVQIDPGSRDNRGKQKPKAKPESQELLCPVAVVALSHGALEIDLCNCF